jgi:hypothetical protein
MITLTLSKDELIELTRYHRANNQLQFLKELGIPAKKRRDNTVCVLRMHCLNFASNDSLRQPTLKSARK